MSGRRLEAAAGCAGSRRHRGRSHVRQYENRSRHTGKAYRRVVVEVIQGEHVALANSDFTTGRKEAIDVGGNASVILRDLDALNRGLLGGEKAVKQEAEKNTVAHSSDESLSFASLSSCSDVASAELRLLQLQRVRRGRSIQQVTRRICPRATPGSLHPREKREPVLCYSLDLHVALRLGEIGSFQCWSNKVDDV